MAENMPIEEIKTNTLQYFKQYDCIIIKKMINDIVEPKTELPKEPKQKAPKKVNRINPNDDRVQGMQLGSYANGLTNDGSGIKNNYFWQCVKCNKIYQQRAEAIECYDMVGSKRIIQSMKKLEIGTIVNANIKGKKYKVKINSIEVNGMFNTRMGMHDSRWNWYYNKQLQYINHVEVLEEIN